MKLFALKSDTDLCGYEAFFQVMESVWYKLFVVQHPFCHLNRESY